jgi:voltage-gated potassium channel
MTNDAPSVPRLRRLIAAADWPLVLLALAVIPLVVLEDHAPSPTVRTWATVANWIIWAAFLTEFLARWAVADFRPRFLARAWPGALLLALTVPVTTEILRGALALRSLRALRALRLLRVGGVAWLALRHLRDGLARRRFHYVGAVACVVVLLGAAGLYVLEGDQNPAVDSVGDALWWAIVTATTVGYGDISPSTLEGRAIAVVLMIVGIGVIGIFTASVASHMFADDREAPAGDLLARLDRIERALDAVRADLAALRQVPGDANASHALPPARRPAPRASEPPGETPSSG